MAGLHSSNQLAVDTGIEEKKSPVGTQLAKQADTEAVPQFHPGLSWSHYRALMRIAEPAARRFYETEAVKANWSRRDLERQIGSLFYERLLASSDQAAMRAGARQDTSAIHTCLGRNSKSTRPA
jgi:hypothetical protein